MFRNYIVSTFRNILRYKGYFLLNILGLTLALAFSLLIMLHIRVESSYENFLDDKDLLYRVTQFSSSTDKHWAVVSPPLAANIQTFIPEIEQSCRYRDMNGNVLKTRNGEGSFISHKIERSFYVDPNAIEMFGYEVVDGDVATALENPEAIVLTESLANRMLGRSDVVGETVYGSSENPLIVSLVIKDIPSNSHVHFEYLRPMQPFLDYFADNDLLQWLESRGWMSFYTYIKLKPGADINKVNEQTLPFLINYWEITEEGMEEFLAQGTNLVLQPLPKIHFNPRLTQDVGPRLDIKYVYIFILIALVVLVVAAVNYVNLTIAISLNRTKEVGIRKVIGATKNQLVYQFMLEAFVLMFISFGLALIIIMLVLPTYNNLTGHSLTISDIFTASNIFLMSGLAIILYLVSSIYPALISSNFRPLITIKGTKDKAGSITFVRKSLVITQFVMSIFMIFSTMVIYRQINYFHQKELGFDKEHVLVYQFYGDLYRSVYENIETTKAEFLKNPAIKSITTSAALPGDHYSVEALIPEGKPDDFEAPPLRVLRVDRDFLKTMNIPILKGKDFSEISSDTTMFILNEAACTVLNLENPVGMSARNPVFGMEGEIIGVAKDFNFTTLHDKIEPLVLELRNGRNSYCLVKVDGRNMQDAVAYLDNVLNGFFENGIYDYQFMEERLDHLYKSEQVVNQLFRLFGVMAVFISCLGLFGMASLSAYKKRKEVCVRKVLGAETGSLFLLLSSQFLKWIALANVIALPLGYFAAKSWLSNFAYHIMPDYTMILATIVISFVIAFVSISFQIFRTITINPATVLRQE